MLITKEGLEILKETFASQNQIYLRRFWENVDSTSRKQKIHHNLVSTDVITAILWLLINIKKIK